MTVKKAPRLFAVGIAVALTALVVAACKDAFSLSDVWKAGFEQSVTFFDENGKPLLSRSAVLDPDDSGDKLTYSASFLPQPPTIKKTGLRSHDGTLTEAEFDGWGRKEEDNKSNFQRVDGTDAGESDQLYPRYKVPVGVSTDYITGTKGTDILPLPTRKTVASSNGGTKRIPTLLAITAGSAKGHLYAFYDNRHGGGDIADTTTKLETVYKWSTNNGDIWETSEKVLYDQAPNWNAPGRTTHDCNGDAGAVYDRIRDKVIVLTVSNRGFATGTSDNPTHIHMRRGTPQQSGDITWEQGASHYGAWDITHFFLGPNCADATRKATWGAAFVTSGNGIQLSSGRIMFCLNVRHGAPGTNQQLGRGNVGTYAIWTDDGGDTWEVSMNSPTSNGTQYQSGTHYGSEAKIAELSDGRLYMQIRPDGHPNDHKGQRVCSFSYDQGQTWTKGLPCDLLPSSHSNWDLVYYTSQNAGWDKDRLIAVGDTWQYRGSTGPSSSFHIDGFNSSMNTQLGYPAIMVSYDNGKTWAGRVFTQGQNAYCSAAILADGSIGILTEGGSWGDGNIYFLKTNMAWVTELFDSCKVTAGEMEYTFEKDTGPTKNRSS